MAARLPSLAYAMRATTVGLLGLLAGCGPKVNEFAPPCPSPAIIADAADIDHFRGPPVPGGGNDLTDLVLHGRIVGVSGSCKQGDKKSQLLTTVNVHMELVRGPAMRGNGTDVFYFVAVTQGENILDKHVYQMPVAFSANVDRQNWAAAPVTFVLPVSVSESGAAYSILVGFQLSPDELAANRLHRGR